MNIIKADLSHLEQIVPLFDAYRVFYKKESDIPAARDYIKTRLENQEATIFLAFEDQNPLGLAICYSTFSSVALKPLVILNDLFTTPEARGKGVGTALLAQSQEFAREQGCAVLRLRTAIDNLTAQSVYENFGFARDNVYYTYDLKL